MLARKVAEGIRNLVQTANRTSALGYVDLPSAKPVAILGHCILDIVQAYFRCPAADGN